eukprot:TRINITY_DN9588_c0_g1_i4.p1 TRINITY_DN9588_c0_g1~~TRINITY_DN9588_c0_g1_i4.p1  ORF type:complete len:486 (+),score=191.19 TRINITY_DN9588_c0_g1_i4:272-1729(+)
MRRSTLRLCDATWKPKPHMMPDLSKFRKEGIKVLQGGLYNYDEGDVHPELHWNKQRSNKVWFSKEDKLKDGFQADMLNESLEVGLDRTELEKRRKKLARPMTTQGGHGASGSEFIDPMDNRGMGFHTHQFAARKNLIDPAWEKDKWNGKFEALRRTFTFEDSRYPYFLYNRLNDRVVMDRKHYPIEIIIQGNQCTVWLSTTYVQSVSEFDFELCHFLDKERQLMERTDWTPVVRKTNPDGSKTFEIEAPEVVTVSQVKEVPLKRFLKTLECDWEVGAGGTMVVTKLLKSWYRVMDVVNSALEICEALRILPQKVVINIHTVTFSFEDSKEGRAAAIALDSLMMQHEEYLSKVWAKEALHNEATKAAAHLADLKEAPRSHFLKNPLGKGTGPMRKVYYEHPADYDNFQKRLAWGEVSYEELAKRFPNQPIARYNPDRPFRDNEEFQHALQVDALKRGLKKDKGGFLDKLQSTIRKTERLKTTPTLE